MDKKGFLHRAVGKPMADQGIDAISVNEAIDRLSELNGQIVTIIGALSLEFEMNCIWHIPMSESRPDALDFFRTSIWVDFDLNALNQQEKWLDQFIGRHVRITGKLAGPNPPYDDGCGHMSLWPAEFLVTAIAKAGADTVDQGD